MSQFSIDESIPPGGDILTLSAEGGANTSPNAMDNFNLSGSIAGGSTADGAIIFSTPANGQMDGVVQTDGLTITINALNRLQVVAANQWTTITISITAQVGVSYVVNSAGLITITLPTGTNLGDTFTLYEVSTGTFTIAQGAAQQIQFGSQITSPGAGSKLTSQNTGDFITLVSNQGGTEWLSIPYNGNFIVG